MIMTMKMILINMMMMMMIKMMSELYAGSKELPVCGRKLLECQRVRTYAITIMMIIIIIGKAS